MNPYDELGVTPAATDEEIKAAYRKLARKLHPDKKGGDTEGFKRINGANAILTDKTRRERYDKTGDCAPTPDDSLQMLQELAGLFLQCLDSVGSVDSVDVLGKVRGAIVAGINNQQYRLTAVTNQ